MPLKNSFDKSAPKISISVTFYLCVPVTFHYSEIIGGCYSLIETGAAQKQQDIHFKSDDESYCKCFVQENKCLAYKHFMAENIAFTQQARVWAL